MEFTPVPSTIETEVELVVEETSKIAEVKADIKRRIDRYRSGQLQRAEYTALSRPQQKIYAKLFGAPKSNEELRVNAKKRAKTKKRRRTVNESRRANRTS